MADSHVHEEFTLALNDAKGRAKAYFTEFPKSVYETTVERWEMLKDEKVSFVMKRLGQAKA